MNLLSPSYRSYESVPVMGRERFLFLQFLRPLGFWCIRTEGLVLFTEARRSWIFRTSPVRSSWSRSALRTCYNCIYYRVNLSRCGRAATCLPTRLGLASHPTKVPPGSNALPNKRREKGVKAYGADPRARPSTLREPRNAVRYCLRVASGRSSPRVRLRREGDPHRYQHHKHLWSVRRRPGHLGLRDQRARR